jgi:hypothetical protein
MKPAPPVTNTRIGNSPFAPVSSDSEPEGSNIGQVPIRQYFAFQSVMTCIWKQTEFSFSAAGQPSPAFDSDTSAPYAKLSANGTNGRLTMNHAKACNDA